MRPVLCTVLLGILLAGCGAKHTLRVENGYPFPVEVLAGNTGGRQSRQADPIGTVPAGSSKVFSGSHPFVQAGTSLLVTTADGKVLVEVREGSAAPGYGAETTGDASSETLRVGPQKASTGGKPHAGAPGSR